MAGVGLFLDQYRKHTLVYVPIVHITFLHLLVLSINQHFYAPSMQYCYRRYLTKLPAKIRLKRAAL
jgi:hypothetical protein